MGGEGHTLPYCTVRGCRIWSWEISFSTQIHCFPDLPEKVLMLVVVRVVIMVVAKVVRVRLILCCLRGFGS